MPFTFEKLDIPDVILITPRIFEDERGSFHESYKASDFADQGISTNFKQDNHSVSKKGVLRGLHFQMPPKTQGKLVRVISGSLFDVVVDIRKGSPTYGKHVSVVLSAENNKILWVPAGFAHGVLALSDNTELLYKCTEEYSVDHERTIKWDDPELGIEWPLDNPVLGEKDKNKPTLSEFESPFVYGEMK